MNTQIVPTPLIAVTEHEGRQAVSLRELHTFLEVGKRFTDWAKSMFEYGFTEHSDYVEVYPQNGINPEGGRPSRNWAISLDMAKELSMIQRTERGKQARQYFIEVEKRAKTAIPTGSELMALAVIEAQSVIASKNQTIAALEPKAASWDSIVSSAGSWSYNDAAKVLCEEGEIKIGEKRLVNLLIDWGHLYRDSKKRPHVYQRDLEKGWFTVKARTYKDMDTGETKESSAPQVRITGKGLDMIRTRLLPEVTPTTKELF